MVLPVLTERNGTIRYYQVALQNEEAQSKDLFTRSLLSDIASLAVRRSNRSRCAMCDWSNHPHDVVKRYRPDPH
eukprot:1693543-Rhodomonas_salina.1